jgi:hypothetical protein
VAAAIFAKPSPWVSEAYSAYDMEPIQFHSAGEVAQYVREIVEKSRGLAFLRVVYPDMGGTPIREAIQLKPGLGHTLRYMWQGWGMISVQLSRHADSPSSIAANSRVRAEKWAPMYPHWASPNTWQWQAVANHTRRLQRVLKNSLRAPDVARNPSNVTVDESVEPGR